MKYGLSDRPKGIRGVFIGVITAVGAYVVPAAFGIRINATRSEPIGLYLRTSDLAADFVEFCPPEPFGALSRLRGYRDSGGCPDGASPLLKAIVARSGDRVDLSERGISVNGISLPNTAPRTADSVGRPLTPWPSGIYLVQPGTVWVGSTYHPRSFDSRYFGPIELRSIRARVRPLIVFK